MYNINKNCFDRFGDDDNDGNLNKIVVFILFKTIKKVTKVASSANRDTFPDICNLLWNYEKFGGKTDGEEKGLEVSPTIIFYFKIYSRNFCGSTSLFFFPSERFGYGKNTLQEWKYQTKNFYYRNSPTSERVSACHQVPILLRLRALVLLKCDNILLQYLSRT